MGGWGGSYCTILPNKTHRVLLDLFLGRAGDWLGNRLMEPTHTAGFSEGLLGVRRCSAGRVVRRLLPPF